MTIVSEGSPEFWNGFVSGVIATLIGFVLTMLWDLWKTRRADRKQAKGVLRALKHECDENVAIVETNHRPLSAEALLARARNHPIRMSASDGESYMVTRTVL